METGDGALVLPVSEDGVGEVRGTGAGGHHQDQPTQARAQGTRGQVADTWRAIYDTQSLTTQWETGLSYHVLLRCLHNPLNAL